MYVLWKLLTRSMVSNLNYNLALYKQPNYPITSHDFDYPFQKKILRSGTKRHNSCPFWWKHLTFGARAANVFWAVIRNDKSDSNCQKLQIYTRAHHYETRRYKYNSKHSSLSLRGDFRVSYKITELVRISYFTG